MKLQAVMEMLLQRQQRARQELEAQQPPPPPEPLGRTRATPEADREPESARMQRAQMATLAAMWAAAAGLGHAPSPSSEDGPRASEDEDAALEGAPGSPTPRGRGREAASLPTSNGRFEDEEEEELEEDLGDDEGDEEDEDYEDEEEFGPAWLLQAFHGDSGSRALSGQERPGTGPAVPGGAADAAPQLQPQHHGDWTDEEQFKQLYELDADPKRKEFLRNLFSFVQRRGTPVNRIPIMARQVLDLFMLYVLVMEKGSLVEVINKKLWREITKGLNLPTSITSAAFTLRTHNPNELQAVIDSNRREGGHQSFGGSLFAYSSNGAHSMQSSPKLPVSSLGLATSTKGSSITPAPKVKKEEDAAIPITQHGQLPWSSFGRKGSMKMALVSEEQQWLMQWAPQQNFLAMMAYRQGSAANLTSTNGSNSISLSVEINGEKAMAPHSRVLFAQPASTPPSAPSKGEGGSSRGGNSGTNSSSSSAGSQAGPAGMSAPPTSTSNNSLP
ncbi:hypothetical protein FD755_000059 [Muntiacus reevesi]|uniref:AT-rich interactive domain-containing protein 3 n=1 Tax=Muntiacus reevesi TaxID=9886 RepID=A0A5J5MZR3_MUNRE|nr:hypothetical protein FD755_000059 [Muntiacus reevesi]